MSLRRNLQSYSHAGYASSSGKILPDSNKVLAKKAAGKMTEEERCAGSASVLLVFLRETRHRTTSDYRNEAVRNQPLVSVILYTIT